MLIMKALLHMKIAVCGGTPLKRDSLSAARGPMSGWAAFLQACVWRTALSLTHTGGLRFPEGGGPLPLAGPAVRYEGLTVAVLMHRTLTHVCDTRPTGGGRTHRTTLRRE